MEADRLASRAPGRSKRRAAALAILLGGVGTHKFYLNQTRTGVAYALFGWTFIPAVLGVIEGIRYLRMRDEAWAAQYGALPKPAHSFSLLSGCLIAVVVYVLLTLVAVAIFDSSSGTIESIGFGTGGSGCTLEGTGSNFAIGVPVHVVAQFAPPLATGDTVTITVSENGSELAGLRDVQTVDKPADCASWTVAPGALTVGHYSVRVLVRPDTSGMPPLGGDFDVTP